MTNQRVVGNILLSVAAVCLFATASLTGEVLDKTKNIGGTTVHYKVILPSQYDPSKAYPGVLAFGGGSQDMEMVDGTIRRFWRQQAEQRGYLVVLPAAPNGVLFFEGGERIFPEFLDKILAEYKIQDNKFHITGMSNGGISSFHVAALYPQYFRSITVFPGYLPEDSDARIQKISKMCINMYVGELDTGWLQDMQEQAAKFRAKGMNVGFAVEKGQGHVPQTLAGDGAKRLFDHFEQASHGCGK
jgi:poly(3-hydroxybutyrate) depolymerase